MLSYDDLGDHEAGYDHEDGYDREDADGHADGAGASLETLHVVDPGDAEEYSGPEPVNVRYLRAQVRTLQEALELQEVAETSAVDRARFRRQVTAALRGLGERTREDESPERTLARVVAAIERLDAPDEVARPVLPTVKFDLSGAQMTLAGPQYVVAPAALGRGPVVTVPAPAPAQPPVAQARPRRSRPQAQAGPHPAHRRAGARLGTHRDHAAGLRAGRGCRDRRPVRPRTRRRPVRRGRGVPAAAGRPGPRPARPPTRRRGLPALPPVVPPARRLRPRT